MKPSFLKTIATVLCIFFFLVASSQPSTFVKGIDDKLGGISISKLSNGNILLFQGTGVSEIDISGIVKTRKNFGTDSLTLYNGKSIADGDNLIVSISVFNKNTKKYYLAVFRLNSRYVADRFNYIPVDSWATSNNIVKLHDGGYAVAVGCQMDNATNNIDYLIKVDSTLQLVWAKKTGLNLVVQSCFELKDGNIYLAGNTFFTGAPSIATIARFNGSNGNFLTGKHYRVIDNLHYTAFTKVQPVSDSSYIVSGSTNYAGEIAGGAYLLKEDMNFNIAWAKQYSNILFSISLNANNSYTGAGSIPVSGHSPGIPTFINLDTAGNVNWKRGLDINTVNTHVNPGNDILAYDSHVNYITGGITTDNGAITPGINGALLVKFLSDGTVCLPGDAVLPVVTTIPVLVIDIGSIDDSLVTTAYHDTLATSDVPVADEINLCNSALPLTLLDFKAENYGKTNLLTWHTAGEINTSHFEINRSTDGRNYTTMGNIDAKGVGKGADYSFNDALVNNGANYYRLKMVDKDGKFTYSKTAVVNNSSTAFTVTLSPNPANGVITLRLSSSAAQQVSVAIFNAEGKLVQTLSYNVATGVTQKQVNVQAYARGVYTVAVKGSVSGLLHVKLVKQ